MFSRFFVAAIVSTGILTTRPTQAQLVPPNVLFVTIDTLRADRLGSYGHAGAKTPVIDRLAAEGVRFSDATAHAPLTYPAHVALLTGRYPAAFGAKLNGMTPLPDTATTLAERLKAVGYSTGAVIGSVVLERSYGLDQGFDSYDDGIPVRLAALVAITDVQRRADQVTEAATTWLKKQPSGTPWFLWAHYYDPHLPYDAPAKYAAAAPGRPYDAEVAFVDAALGRLLASVDRQRTLIIVTADHGEALGEHGEPDHGFFLYDSTLHVPLVIAPPSPLRGIGEAPRVVTEQVRSIDLFPTILEMVGAGAQSTVDGVSLVPLLRGESRREVPVSVAESWYPRLHFGWSELRSARVGEWKYIEAPKPELYDLRVDRAERRNMVHERASVAGRLAGEITRVSQLTDSGAIAETPQPDRATLERLQALGYVGTLAPVAAGRSTENPLDRIANYRAYRTLFTQALTLLAEKRAAAAAAVLQRLAKANVRAFEVHLYLGNAYAAQGKMEAALGEYDMAAILNPAIASPHFEAAKVLAARGDPAAAVERCRAGLRKEPRSFYGHYTLGVVHQQAGQWPDALAAFSRAVEINGKDPRAHANLAGAAMRTGDLDRAATHLGHMIELGHQVAAAHFNLGTIAARKGDPAEAARRYRLSIAADPKFEPARQALARTSK